MADLRFTPLHTERLTLRCLYPLDAAPLARYRSDPEVARYQGWGETFSEARALALIQEMQGREPGQDGWFQFAVEEQASGALLGDLGLNVFSPRQAEIGFTLARSAQGRGYGREAVSALLDLCFGALHLHRIVAGSDPRNLRSAALLRHLGFRDEGHLVEAYFDGERWLNEDRFALLGREWRGP